MVTRRKLFTMSEDAECAAFVRWLETQKPNGLQKFTHIANETPTNIVQAARLKRVGVRAGVPDYLLIVRKKLVFIEMKRAAGGRVSAEQQEWIDVLKLTAAEVHVCEGFREAKQVVSNLLARC